MDNNLILPYCNENNNIIKVIVGGVIYKDDHRSLLYGGMNGEKTSFFVIEDIIVPFFSRSHTFSFPPTTNQVFSVDGVPFQYKVKYVTPEKLRLEKMVDIIIADSYRTRRNL